MTKQYYEPEEFDFLAYGDGRLEEYEAAAFPRQLIEGGRQALGEGLRH